MSFIARSHTLPAENGRAAFGSVVKALELGLLATAAAIVDDARAGASAIAASAIAEKEVLLAASRDELERSFLRQAGEMECRYRELLNDLQTQLEPILDRIVVATLQRMGWEAPADVRLRVLTGEIAAAAGPVSGAILQVSPADAECLAETELIWPLEVSPHLAAGRCRLLADNGSWTADFSQAVERFAKGDNAPHAPTDRITSQAAS